jgi:hypothetical protein
MKKLYLIKQTHVSYQTAYASSRAKALEEVKNNTGDFGDTVFNSKWYLMDIKYSFVRKIKKKN